VVPDVFSISTVFVANMSIKSYDILVHILDLTKNTKTKQHQLSKKDRN